MRKSGQKKSLANNIGTSPGYDSALIQYLWFSASLPRSQTEIGDPFEMQVTDYSSP